LHIIQLILASKIKAERVRQGLFTQKDFAKRADIPLSTYSRMEQLGEGSIKDLIKVLAGLKRINDLELILRTQDEDLFEIVKKSKVRKKSKSKDNA
jgi:predicted transcriptional regulator